MAAIASRFDFHPPQLQGTARALSWAVFVHLALLGALTWGVSWEREATLSTVEAELWSSLPQQAAPKLQETASPLAPQAEKAPEPPAQKKPEIATEKETQKPQLEPKPASEVNKVAENRKRAAQREKEHQEQLQRMAGLADASGGSVPQNKAQPLASISTNYQARIEARVRPNHVFTGDIANNPRVEIEIRLDPSGLIQGKPRILKSSGSREFDESVVRAFEKTEILPRDENGRVPSSIQFDWSARRAL